MRLLLASLATLLLSSCVPLADLQNEYCPYWSVTITENQSYISCRATPNDTGEIIALIPLPN